MSEIKVFTKEQQKEHPQLTKEYKETLNKLKEDLDFVLPDWIEFDDEIYFDDYDYKKYNYPTPQLITILQIDKECDYELSRYVINHIKHDIIQEINSSNSVMMGWSLMFDFIGLEYPDGDRKEGLMIFNPKQMNSRGRFDKIIEEVV
tara:strand:+ start:182 stop:622 length:441 start_codon:yes stop_codon:yes gene_type:complete